MISLSSVPPRTESTPPQTPPTAQNPVPANAPAAPEPVASQMQRTFDRLHRMVDANMKLQNISPDIDAFTNTYMQFTTGNQDVQDAFTLVKAKMLEAKETIDALDAKNIQDIISTNKVDPLVKHAINAQDKLKNAFKLLAETSGIDFSTQMNMCDRRTSETLNFVGKMMHHLAQGALPHEARTQSFSENLRAVSFEMHGSQGIVASIQKELTTLFSSIDKVYTKLDALEESPHLLSHGQFTSTVKDLTHTIHKITQKLDPQQNKNIRLDVASTSIEAIKTSLQSAAERLERLKATTKHDAVEHLLSSFDTYRMQVGKDFINFVNTMEPTKGIKNYILQYSKNIEDIRNIMHKQPIDSEHLLEAIQSLKKTCDSDITLAETINKYVQIAATTNEEEFNHELAVLRTQDTQDADIFINNFILPLRTYEESHPGTLAHVSVVYDKSFLIEATKLAKIINELPKNLHETGEFIHAVLHSPVDLSSMLELKMRGFPLRNTILNTTQDNFHEDRVLGQGVANQVFLCTYGTETGENVQYVFKGEYRARQGLVNMSVKNLGYHHDTYVNALNVACTEVAQMIGCQSAIAESKVGLHKGQFGLFMNVAEGKTPSALNNEAPVFTDTEGREVRLHDLGASLDDEQEKIFIASLAKELTKLEWIDALTGQVDRHEENYLFAFDPISFQAKITGIDNDASFSKGMIGVGKAETTSLGVTTVTDFSDELQPNEINKLRGVFGFNQIFKPLFISQDIYDKLHEIDEDDYKRLLTERIGKTEVDSAILRLRDAKQYAHTLKVDGLCFAEHEWNSPKLFCALHEAMEYQEAHLQTQQKNFVARDFYHLRGIVGHLANMQNTSTR